MTEEQRNALNAELGALTADVKAIIAKRKQWMDDHMSDFAKFRVGDEIYDRATGKRLGTVTKLYRFWGDRDPTYDTSMSVEYEFKVGGEGNLFDNTSRYGVYTDWAFCTRYEAAEEQEKRARALRDTRTDEEKWASVFAR